jgi:hypothetical protein
LILVWNLGHLAGKEIVMNRKTRISVRIILLLVVAVFTIRGLFVHWMVNHIDTMSRAYIGFIEEQFPGETRSIDAYLIRKYVLPKSTPFMIVDLRKWSVNSFVRDGDVGWYQAIESIYDQLQFIAASKYCRESYEASMSFQARQAKWRSSGVKPSLKIARQS